MQNIYFIPCIKKESKRKKKKKKEKNKHAEIKVYANLVIKVYYVDMQLLCTNSLWKKEKW